MSKIASSIVGLLLLPGTAVAQQSAELNIGWLDYSAGAISQDLSVKNTGWVPIRTVRIRCRFVHFSERSSQQLGSGAIQIKNIAPNAIGYKTMTLASHTAPTSATCNIVSAKYAPSPAY